jgi:hypothetical protein
MISADSDDDFAFLEAKSVEKPQQPVMPRPEEPFSRVQSVIESQFRAKPISSLMH